MSYFVFGFDDYSRTFYPFDATDGMGGVEWNEIERVKIEDISFVRERTTTRSGKFKTKYGAKVPLCELCGYSIGDKRWNFCPKCGAKVVEK